MYHVVANESAYQDYNNTLKAVLSIIKRSETMEQALDDLEKLESCLYNTFIEYDAVANACTDYYNEYAYNVSNTAYNADTVVDAIITYATGDYMQFPTDYIAAFFTPTFLC